MHGSQIVAMLTCQGAYREVFGDHLERDLEDSFKNFGNLLLHALLQLVDDGSKQTQHLCIPAQSQTQISQTFTRPSLPTHHMNHGHRVQLGCTQEPWHHRYVCVICR